MPADFDAIAIGAGHNALVAANLLAQRGWSVLVLEAQPEPGGAVRSGELSAARLEQGDRVAPDLDRGGRVDWRHGGTIAVPAARCASRRASARPPPEWGNS